MNVADLDGDGRPDVITRNSKVSDYNNFTYSIRRNVTPDGTTPTLVSLVPARVEDGVVQLDWFAAGNVAGYSGTIERSTASAGWSQIARRTSDGTGHLRYADAQVEAGETYGYRLRTADTGGELVSEVTWVTVPAVTFALRGAWPNPASPKPTFLLSLPAAGEAELQVLDVAGRVVRRERLAGLGPGPHRVALSGTALAPGYFVVRLGFGGRRLQTSFVVLR